MAIKIGHCNAEPIIEFLHVNAIDWEDNGDQIHDNLRRGRAVAIDNEMWIITIAWGNSVTLVNDNDVAISIDVFVAVAMAGLLPK